MDRTSFAAGRAYCHILMVKNAWRELYSAVRDEESVWQAKTLLQPFEFELPDALERALRQLEEQSRAD